MAKRSGVRGRGLSPPQVRCSRLTRDAVRTRAMQSGLTRDAVRSHRCVSGDALSCSLRSDTSSFKAMG
eukprot:3632403-Prymnesium_polylepis.1